MLIRSVQSRLNADKVVNILLIYGRGAINMPLKVYSSVHVLKSLYFIVRNDELHY